LHDHCKQFVWRRDAYRLSLVVMVLLFVSVLVMGIMCW